MATSMDRAAWENTAARPREDEPRRRYNGRAFDARHLTVGHGTHAQNGQASADGPRVAAKAARPERPRRGRRQRNIISIIGRSRQGLAGVEAGDHPRRGQAEADRDAGRTGASNPGSDLRSATEAVPPVHADRRGIGAAPRGRPLTDSRRSRRREHRRRAVDRGHEVGARPAAHPAGERDRRAPVSEDANGRRTAATPGRSGEGPGT